MKIFDFKNPRHIEILKEEMTRAKNLLKEYNRSEKNQHIKRIIAEDINGFSADEIWNAMPETDRYNALAATNDNTGPDIADKFVNSTWDEIDANVQDMIDLSQYELAKRNQAGRTHLRAIDNLKKQTSAAQRLVDKYLQKVNRTDVNSLTNKQAMDLNIKIIQLISPKGSSSSTSTDSNIDPYDRENPSRGYMGSTYRGD